jgi:hypothetical protein
MKIFNIVVFVPLLSLAMMNFAVSQVSAATSPNLGTADSYSILAGSSITNTGSTTISGNVGISPGTVAPNYTGFNTVTLGGTIHDADSAALTAQSDKNTAYSALASQGCDIDYGAVTTELAGKNLLPGVYCSTSFHLSSGTLTLNGNSSDVWIFKSASDLIISGGNSAKVVFTGGGQACNVWWRVVSTATFDANSSLVGNILADTSITFSAGASLNGRALARTAAVTLSSNSITGPICNAASVGGSNGGGGSEELTPPLFSVTKVANPLVLPLGPGLVTYTYTIVNKGSVPVDHVVVRDDKCALVTLISGDKNRDRLLDINEKWIFRCTTTLQKTTTNIVTVVGYANGLNARVTANAKVVVGTPEKPISTITTVVVPKLPNTGMDPRKENTFLVLMLSIWHNFFLSVLNKTSN